MKKITIKLCLILSLVLYPLSAEYKGVALFEFKFDFISSSKKIEKIINDIVEKGYQFVHISDRTNFTLLIFKKNN